MRIAQHIFCAAVLAVALEASSVASEPTILVEAASLVVGPADEATLYLVINNTSATQIVLTSVSSPSAREAVLVRSNGEPLPSGAIVPAHAELYMQPNTVHVALSGVTGPLRPGSLFPLTLMLDGGTTADVLAQVVNSEAELPDHHDYRH